MNILTILGIIAVAFVIGSVGYIVLQLILWVTLARAMAKVVLPIILEPMGFTVRSKPEPFRMLGTQAWLQMVEMRCQR